MFLDRMSVKAFRANENAGSADSLIDRPARSATTTKCQLG